MKQLIKMARLRLDQIKIQLCFHDSENIFFYTEYWAWLHLPSNFTIPLCIYKNYGSSQDCLEEINGKSSSQVLAGEHPGTCLKTVAE